jgi:GNAT superfamily N-acetyltransferase
MPLEIVPVETARELRRFIDVPWHVYDKSRHPEWVPPLRIAVRDMLNDRKHPFYQQAARALWIARRDGKPVGRIAAIENRAHNAHYEDRVGFFGFFEAKDDSEAAQALLDTAARWLRARGLESMRGPMNPSTNYECGLLVDGFAEHPMFMTTWNPPYYVPLLERAGFTGVKDLLGWWVPAQETDYVLPPVYARQAARAREQQDVVFRDIDPKNIATEAALAWDVYNAAWEQNWGFIPMSRVEFDHLCKDLKQVVDPRWAFAAEVNGEPAGIAIAIPDYHEIFKRIPNGRLLPTGIFKLLSGAKKLNTTRVMVLGVKREFRTRGIFALFLDEFFRRARRYGLVGGEASWVLEDNVRMNRPLETIGARPYRRWRIYERPLGGADGARPAGGVA